jgi:palmitoyl-protein thioesterase
MFSILIAILLVCRSIDGQMYRPVVLMHGVTATASDMDELAGWLRQSFEGIYVVSIEIGNGFDDSFLLPMNRQVELFCQTVQSDVNLKEGFNMVGVSQGSLIVRGAVERCSLPVYNLITLVGIHQGVFGIPGLQMLPPSIREIVSKYAYEEAVQNVISVAGYWRDPYQLDKYFKHSHFLPIINNEGNNTNETYRLNMLKLNSFVMIYSDIDEVVSPPHSSWFLGFLPNTLEAETWNQSRQYTEDLIGMKTLNEQGKLHFFTCHTQHQDAQHTPDKDFFFQNILTFFNNTIEG